MSRRKAPAARTLECAALRMAAEAGLRIPPVEVRTLGYPDVAVNMLADPALAVFCSLASTGGALRIIWQRSPEPRS